MVTESIMGSNVVKGYYIQLYCKMVLNVMQWKDLDTPGSVAEQVRCFAEQACADIWRKDSKYNFWPLLGNVWWPFSSGKVRN